ncbi:MAG: HesA/MoeB/ThiF family protein [Candidatus Omnitrophica bacterium]|nr:HesA/MoeB/ThiF family protein [Candidatus Omnitrophota bacterium]
MTITREEAIRYDRQMHLPVWGADGQERLKAATVFIAGAGGLGSSCAFYLAAAGVGSLLICDYDAVELSNLNRQIVHTTGSVGESKAFSAQVRLGQLNPAISIRAVPEKITESNIEDFAAGSDIIVDCLDNIPGRYILNGYCIAKHLPLVYASIWGFTGQLSFFWTPETGCFRCMMTTAPPPELFPVVGVTPGIMGALQATEVIKYITGIGKIRLNELLIFDGETLSFSWVRLRKNPTCPSCGMPDSKYAA